MCDFTSVEPTGDYKINVGDIVDLHDATLGKIGIGGKCIKNDSDNFRVDNIFVHVSFAGKTLFTGTIDTIQFSFQSGYWSLYTEVTSKDGNTNSNTVNNISCESHKNDLIYRGTYDSGDSLKIKQWAKKGLHFDGVNLCDAGVRIPSGLPCKYNIWFMNANTEDEEVSLSKNLTLTGRLVDSNGKGLAGLTIEAWDKDRITKDDALGADTTTSDGFFKISIDQSDHKEWIFDRKPDVYFKVCKKGDLLHSTEDKVMWNIKEPKQVEIQL